MSSKTSKQFAKVSPKLPVTKRVMQFQSHSLSQSVVSIGYRVDGVISSSQLKENLVALKKRLGGKAAGLADLSRLEMSVPPAFNLGTDLCGLYLMRHELPEAVLALCRKAMAGLEKTLSKNFGGSKNPLLVSVRSGARISMPGMMDTILNLGLNTEITAALAIQTPANARFWWDCYRRLIQMYSNVVLNADHSAFENILSDAKAAAVVETDSELSASSLRKICEDYLKYLKSSGYDFPQDPWKQLTLAIEAVFRSWNTDRAIHYRKLNQIPQDWGTSVTVQAMVFGNLNHQSGTGVVFTRDPSMGENEI
jgi:pyruvate,orthophosphate dikinase